MRKILAVLLALMLLATSLAGGLVSAQEQDYAIVTSVETQVFADVWYIAVFTFDQEVGDEYLNTGWFKANGIRVSEHADGVHSTVIRWGTDGYQIAVYFHDNIRPAFGINKDDNDVFEFDPIEYSVVYSVDIALPAEIEAGLRGNIILSGESLGIEDITDNEQGVVITFFLAPNGMLRTGIHEVFNAAGELDGGLLIRNDLPNVSSFTLQLGVDGDGNFMLYTLNQFPDPDHQYVNQMVINHINWNTAQENKRTDNLMYGTIYDGETFGPGWEGHDGVINFFGNFPENLTAVYDNATLAYTWSNEVINNITAETEPGTPETQDPATDDPATETPATEAPGDSNGFVYVVFAAAGLVAVLMASKMKKAYKK